MPVEITGAHPPEHRLKPGDVIMVRRQLFDKKTKKPFDWKYFALVLKVAPRGLALRHIILDGREDREPTVLYMNGLGTEEMSLWFLPENEWPDGVHVFRTKLILEGRVDDIDNLLF